MSYSLFCRYQPVRFPASRSCLLVFSWVTGLSFGVKTALAAGAHLAPVFLPALRQPAGYFGLITASLLPVFASAASHFLGDWTLFPVCAADGFLLALSAVSVLLLFESGGWLAMALFLFARIASLPALWWYWSHLRDRARFRRNTCICAIVCAMLALADRLLVSPFLIAVL